MSDPLTDDELAELESESAKLAQWALDEADVRRFSIWQRACRELRALRQEVIERRAAETSMKQHLDNIEEQLATVKNRGR